jgi:hypothetical protein
LWLEKTRRWGHHPRSPLASGLLCPAVNFANFVRQTRIGAINRIAAGGPPAATRRAPSRARLPRNSRYAGSSLGRGILTTRLGYDVSIWEEIRFVVYRKTHNLLGKTQKEISNDRSLAEFQRERVVPWQLREIMAQRAEGWVQRLYEACCDAYKGRDKALSADFDRAVWAYCIEPFIMGEKPLRSDDYTVSPLLELLFCAVGSPPEMRLFLRVSQKDCCLGVRRQVYETWYDKLHHLAPRINEAVAAMGRANEMEARAMRIARGLPPEPPTQLPTADQAAPLVQPAPTPAPQPIPEASSAALLTSPASPQVQNETVIEQESITKGDTPSQSGGVQEAAWEAIEIEFLSDERVQIRNGANSETRNYAEFGFADGRNENPNQAWKILRALAAEGVIRNEREVGLPWPKVEKQIQEIRKILRKHFGISADPVPFVKDLGYKACFKIGLGRSFHT